MKEKQPFKQFDLFSLLAITGVVLVLFFESIFVFELYRMDYAQIEPYVPVSVKPSVEHWVASLDLDPIVENVAPDSEEGITDPTVETQDVVGPDDEPELVSEVVVAKSEEASAVVTKDTEPVSSVVIEYRDTVLPDDFSEILSIPAQKDVPESDDEKKPVPVG